MSSAETDESDLRELAREEPEAFRSVAESGNDAFREWMMKIYREERNERNR